MSSCLASSSSSYKTGTIYDDPYADVIQKISGTFKLLDTTIKWITKDVSREISPSSSDNASELEEREESLIQCAKKLAQIFKETREKKLENYVSSPLISKCVEIKSFCQKSQKDADFVKAGWFFTTLYKAVDTLESELKKCSGVSRTQFGCGTLYDTDWEKISTFLKKTLGSINQFLSTYFKSKFYKINSMELHEAESLRRSLESVMDQLKEKDKEWPSLCSSDDKKYILKEIDSIIEQTKNIKVETPNGLMIQTLDEFWKLDDLRTLFDEVTTAPKKQTKGGVEYIDYYLINRPRHHITYY